jgi:valyl-tRNA synthetase
MGPVDEGQIRRLQQSGSLELEHRWMLSRLQTLIAEVDDNLEKYRFHDASNQLYHFFWHEFCDWYIELVKAAITGRGHAAAKERAAIAATYCLETSLRLLHPFIPFITEELWQRLPRRGETIMLQPFPEARPEWLDAEACAEMEALQELITAVRTARAENNLDPRRKFSMRLVSAAGARESIAAQLHHLRSLAHLDEVELVDRLDGDGPTVQGTARLGRFAITLEAAVDLEAERQRLVRQTARLSDDVAKLEAKLGNAGFLERAPAEVVAEHRRRYQEALRQLQDLQEKLGQGSLEAGGQES